MTKEEYITLINEYKLIINNLDSIRELTKDKHMNVIYAMTNVCYDYFDDFIKCIRYSAKDNGIEL